MSRYIATSAIKGAHAIVEQAGEMLDRALKEFGPKTPVAFTNTAYFLPTIYGYTGQKIGTLGDMVPCLLYTSPSPRD